MPTPAAFGRSIPRLKIGFAAKPADESDVIHSAARPTPPNPAEPTRPVQEEPRSLSGVFLWVALPTRHVQAYRVLVASNPSPLARPSFVIVTGSRPPPPRAAGRHCRSDLSSATRAWGLM